jgi:ABC-type multidrug transport system fused ATPase/permease subunit
MDCLDRFHLWEKIRKTSSGLDVTVGERTWFSGWQEQLLVLIRILLQDRPILIFDEWTNQLDADNELMVMDELLKNKQDKIIIFITHRMTTMRRADYIYCLEEGLITNQWKHDELLAKDSIYARFWKKQVEE